MKALKRLLYLSFIISGCCPCAKNQVKATIPLSGKCLIVSDIHLNPFFSKNGVYQSDDSLVTALSAADVSQWESILDQKAANMIAPNLRGHDANYAVVVSALNNMYNTIQKPDFIIIAGDFIWHNSPISDETLKQKSIQFIASLFRKKYKDIPIIPTYGNNDSALDYQKQSPQFLANFANAWNFAGLGIDTAAYRKGDGYYSTSIGKLKFVVMNTTLVSQGGVSRGYNYYTEGYEMLSNWLPNELADTSKNIWIISHIPPGVDGYSGGQMWSSSGPAGSLTDLFSQQVGKNSKQIRMMIASHTHLNDFKVFYKGKSTDSASAISYMRIVPSIGMDHGNNPSYEVAEYDTVSYRFTKETNYYLNLSGMTQPVPESVKWDRTLSINKWVGSKPATPVSLSDFIDKMVADKSLPPVYDIFYGVGVSGGFTTNFNYHIAAERQPNNLP
ncbi:MAG TPA: metallophosphoesterase [Mucilaginibacter sp.]